MRVMIFASIAFLLMTFLAPGATEAAATVRGSVRIGGHGIRFAGGSNGWAVRYGFGTRHYGSHCYPYRYSTGRRIIIVPGYARWPWYGYGYGYGGAYDTAFYAPPQRQYFTQPISAPATRTIVVTASPPPRDPWALLAEGSYDLARGRFAIDAQQGSARANVGYALASALSGRHGDAAWAMRKAVEQDAHALATIPTAELRGKLDALAADYTSGAAKLAFADDRAFITAAIHYLRGDTDAARAAIQAIKDDERSTQNLRELLEK